MDARPVGGGTSNFLQEDIYIMNTQRFLLYLEMDGGRFTLKRDGESWVQEFSSLLDALQYARGMADSTDSRLSVFDEAGRTIIETFV